MSEPSTSAPEPTPIDELVAYLDGELSAEESQRVEAQLASDPRVRSELNRLEVVWDALDALPRDEVDEAFTQATVEVVAGQADNVLTEQLAALPNMRRRRVLLMAATFLGTLLLALLVVRFGVPDPNQALLADLRMLERLDQYRAVGGTDFLQHLVHSQRFAADAAWPTVIGSRDLSTGLEQVPAPDQQVVTTEPPGNETPQQRRARVAAMSPAEKDLLRRRLEWFQQRPQDEQRRLRALDRTIFEAADSGQLSQLVARYHAWFRSFRPEQQRELLELPAGPRLETIERWSTEHQQRLAAAQQLSDQDIEGLLEWLVAWVRSKRPQDMGMLRLMRPGMPGVVSPRARLAMLHRRGWMLANPTFLARLPREDYAGLLAKLTPETRTLLEQHNSQNEQSRQLNVWINAAVRSYLAEHGDSFGRRPPSEEELWSFFQDLSRAEQARLEGLEPAQMRNELQQLYFTQNRREGIRPPQRQPGGPDRPRNFEPKGPPGRRPERP